MRKTNRSGVAIPCCVFLFVFLKHCEGAPAPSEGMNAAPLLGAANFIPSPEHPVGFGGDGSFWYAGANPPCEFQDGTRNR